MIRPTLSVIIPAYRQASTVCHELYTIDAFLQTLNMPYEMILVIDGNEDDSLSAVLEHCHLSSLRIECFEENQGKGSAVRHGLLHGRGDLLAFIDAGGDLDPSALKVMLALQELHHADIVIGSKRHSLSEVSYPFLRRVYSFCYQLLNRILFRLRVRDTQVGMKLFRRNVLEAVLPRLLVKRFAFDLELLVVARRLGFRRLVEAPIHLTHQFTSSVSVTSVWFTLIDTLAIFWRLHIRRWYDTVHTLEHAPEPIKWTPASIPHTNLSLASKMPLEVPTTLSKK